MLCYPPVCDARYKHYRSGLWNGVIEEGKFVEPEDQDRDHFAEQGKLSSELAFIYIYFGLHVLLIKSKKLFMWCLPQKLWFWKPFPKYKYIILTPYLEILAGISFPNYRMGKILFTQNSFWKYLCGGGIPRCRCGNGEMVNGDVYEKCTLCPCTYRTNNTLCDQIYPPMGKGLSHIICSY